MLHIITGGSGSGKSAYAEEFLCSLGTENRIYIATMKAYDQESFNRIKRHQRMRAHKQFTTIECSCNLKEQLVPKDAYVLLECMSNLVANERYQEDKVVPINEVIENVLEGVKHILRDAKEVVIVTNEVFSEGSNYDPETIEYIKCLGAINKQLGALAESVTEVVYGIPVIYKGSKIPTKEEVYEKTI